MAEILTHVVCWDYKFRKTSWRGKVTFQHPELDIERRLEQVGAAAREGQEALQGWVAKLEKPPSDAAIVNPDKPLVVFVAPEFLFTRVRIADRLSPIDHQYYHRADRTRYESFCRQLSGPHDGQHTLTVVGSMLWVEGRTDRVKAELRQRSRDYVFDKMTSMRPIPQAARAGLTQWADVLRDVDSDTRTHLAFNEAFLCFDGKTEKSIKKSEYGVDFTAHMDEMTLVAGIGAGTKTVQVGGKSLKVGVGICIDSSRVKAYNGDVDLYILVSQTIDAGSIPAGTVRTGGLAIQADGSVRSRILQGTGGGMATASPTKSLALETHNEGAYAFARALITVPD